MTTLFPERIDNILLTLAFESSAKAASVAVCSADALLGQYFQNNGLTHSRTLLAMAESLLKNLEITAGDFDVVAVSRGPGSFTGVRIGVAAAKGFAWGIDKPVCGVSTLKAMACQLCHTGAAEAAEAIRSPGIICAVMDARRGQVYNALFSCKGGKPERLCEDRAISLAELALELKSRDAPVIIMGDGSEIGCRYLSEAGIICRTAPSLLRWQTAYGVALAALGEKPVPPAELEPAYLRPSQAERLLDS